MIVTKRNKDYDNYKLGGTSSASHLIFANDVLFLHQSQPEIFNFFVKHPPELLQSHCVDYKSTKRCNLSIQMMLGGLDTIEHLKLPPESTSHNTSRATFSGELIEGERL